MTTTGLLVLDGGVDFFLLQTVQQVNIGFFQRLGFVFVEVFNVNPFKIVLLDMMTLGRTLLMTFLLTMTEAHIILIAQNVYISICIKQISDYVVINLKKRDSEFKLFLVSRFILIDVI